MVEDHEAARCAATRGARLLVERTRAGEGAQDAVVAQILEGLLADLHQGLDLFIGRARVLGVVDAHRRRAEDRDRAVRHEDVAVRRLVQAVDDVVRKALIEGDQSPLVRLHRDVQPRKLGDLLAPAARRIDEDVAGDRIFLAREAVAHAHAFELAVLLLDADDLCIRLVAAAVAHGGSDVLARHAETVDRRVGHGVGGDNMTRQARLHAERFIERQRTRFDAARLTAFDPARLEVRIVRIETHEHAADWLDTRHTDLSENHVLLDALLRGFLILDRVASTAVQEAMIARACTVDEILLFEEQNIDAAHGKIAQYADTRSSSSDDDDCCLLHIVLLS